MPTYQLESIYGGVSDETKRELHLTTIHDDTNELAIAKAEQLLQKSAHRALHVATLRSDKGRFVWRLRSPAAEGDSEA